MTWVIKNHRILVIVAGIMLFALIAWVIFSRQDFDKIPSRGVFV